MSQDKITVDELKQAPEGSVQFIDVRKRPDDQQIRGSVRYDAEKLLEADTLALPLDHDAKIVVYCGSGNSCFRIAERMREQGFANAVALEGGYAAAKDAGLPLEEISLQQPIP
jgi:rhodanese-related sulfurtransferase